MKQYEKLITTQFNKSKGYTDIPTDSNNYIDELVNWLELLRNQSEVYVDLCNDNNIYLADDTSIELNKGVDDTLFDGKEIISPFGSTVRQKEKILMVSGGVPLVYVDYSVEDASHYRLFHTFNPYSKGYRGPIAELHNSGYNICYGMFGSNSDKDKDEKLNDAKEMHSKLINYNSDIIYETNKNNYYCIVYSKPLFRIRTYKRVR